MLYTQQDLYTLVCCCWESTYKSIFIYIWSCVNTFLILQFSSWLSLPESPFLRTSAFTIYRTHMSACLKSSSMVLGFSVAPVAWSSALAFNYLFLSFLLVQTMLKKIYILGYISFFFILNKISGMKFMYYHVVLCIFLFTPFYWGSNRFGLYN